MIRRFIKWLLLAFAIPTCALIAYAELTGDADLRLTALSILAVLLAAAYAFGLFRRNPETARRKSYLLPTQAQTPADDLRVAAQQAKPPAPEPTPEDCADQIKDDELYIVFSRLAGFKTGEAFRANVDTIISRNKLASLSADDIDRLAKEIDRRDLRGKAFVRTPGIALVRLQRADLDVAVSGTSWLGGLPTLGDLAWPRAEDGRAMHHLAQIDLGTVPDPLLPQGMPKNGAMAFFMTTETDKPHKAKLVYIPQIGTMATEPPDDIAPIYDGPDWGYHIKGYARESAPDTFPRWPVEFVLLPMADQNRDDDARALMDDLLSYQSEDELSPSNYRQSLPDFARPWFWDSAHRFTMSIRLAREDLEVTKAKADKRVRDYGPGYQPARDALDRDTEAFSAYVDEVSLWAVSHAPWDKMTPEDVAILEGYFGQVRDVGGKTAKFKPFYQFTQGELLSLDEIATATLVAAANESPEVFAALPYDVRQDIDNCYRIAAKGCWHQMFGRGYEVQSAVSDHTHHHLLLQLHSDQLMNWMWGDRGVLQFWITEEDMLAQNWDAVEMTFESR